MPRIRCKKNACAVNSGLQTLFIPKRQTPLLNWKQPCNKNLHCWNDLNHVFSVPCTIVTVRMTFFFIGWLTSKFTIPFSRKILLAVMLGHEITLAMAASLRHTILSCAWIEEKSAKKIVLIAEYWWWLLNNVRQNSKRGVACWSNLHLKYHMAK